MSSESNGEAGKQSARNAVEASPARVARDFAVLAVLEGDRVCTGCGFNLRGQQVTREEHYNMLMVRCPECARVTGLQEYPLLTPWGMRMRFVMAAGYFLMCLAIVAVAVGVGFATVTSTRSTATYAALQPLQTSWTEHVAQVAAEAAAKARAEAAAKAGGDAATVVANTAAAAAPPPNAWTQPFDQAWWDAQPAESKFMDAGAEFRLWMIAAKHMLMPALFLLVPLGVVMSVLMPHLSMLRRLALLLFVVGIASVLLWYHSTTVTVGWGFGMQQTTAWGRMYSAIDGKIAPRLYAAAGIMLGGGLFIGMLFGRVLARWMIMLFLPPSLRVPWAFLWLVDGKRLPRVAMRK